MPISGGNQFLNPQDILAKAELVEGMQVADLGCGNLGYFIIPAAKIIGKEGKAYAVDVMKSVLEAVKSQAKLEGLYNIETVWSNLEKVGSTAISAGSLDVAFLINVLYQNKNYQSMLEEASRLLKQGGKLIIADWNKANIPFGPPVEQRVDPAVVKEAAKNVNLELSAETNFGDYFWGLVYFKV